ncbi:cupin 2, conserved barrel domain protein [Basidiobolus meristosporus CBS 931.73]|uniref:Cupin 2, conserved barrel domain protein n=1 Tax=Basidiobolus meristosporus CBS 931.73 TaxID=1314790 RepID=A0A1Y1Z4Q1_9FUNG|nr:cupin 2, conserved barrel domain protein [Basidiobolus meristosporus CBS 931.73]|eukprot:ORY05258.1 cupin 2, conserved barrel domain protein [Basidiobolus meristosporus CBS 931.73]
MYNERNTVKSPHVISLIDQKPTFNSEAGSITALTADDFPILQRLSIRRLILKPRAVREPHWHANGNELAYCLRGEVVVTIFENNSVFSTFTVGAGQMFYAPSGALHHIENVGEEEAELILSFTHERPEDFGISGAFGAMSDAVLGNTYSLPADAFKPLRRSTQDTHIGRLQSPAPITTEEKWENPHKFDVEAMSAPISSPEGSAKTARKQFWPILDDISMYSLRVTDKGMREPHWHPVTAEMGYVVKGNARMTIMNPGGSLDTYLLKPGDVYFVPRAYPHHIENVGTDDIHFLIFFDQNTPGDIGYRASISGYSRETLAAAFGTDVGNLPELPFTAKDPLLVERINPVDPVDQNTN